jgi:long-chain acyl-CoA synthetase
MLTHGNITSNVTSTAHLIDLKPGEIALSILPLSHILERMADYFYLFRGLTIAYAENVTKVAENLQDVKPHVFAAVPRLFEKMRARIMDNVATMPPARQKLFHWALRVAEERLPYRVDNKPMPLGLKVKSTIADKLVFKKIHQRPGGMVLCGGSQMMMLWMCGQCGLMSSTFCNCSSVETMTATAAESLRMYSICHPSRVG